MPIIEIESFNFWLEFLEIFENCETILEIYLNFPWFFPSKFYGNPECDIYLLSKLTIIFLHAITGEVW